MQLILPDVLTAAHGLSPGAAGFLMLVGFLLWAVGWRWHKFWVVFGITLTAGLIGLSAGQAAGGRVMVVGVLLAVAAGMLALELAKVLAFVTGGAAAWAAAQAVFPQVQELWAVFLSGGLIGVVLYQLWTMLTTSFVGVLVTWHAGFVLADQLVKGFDAAKWVGEHAAALNGGVAVVTLLGVLVQRLTSPRPESADESRKSPKRPAPHAYEEPAEARGWWSWARPGRSAA
ncbi:MAG TPA: hypothetical protein VFG68_15610 [Fimbriiglobus sp.]|nr:hypothetical protein [Fimbriiglobus sp.]